MEGACSMIGNFGGTTPLAGRLPAFALLPQASSCHKMKSWPPDIIPNGITPVTQHCGT